MMALHLASPPPRLCLFTSSSSPQAQPQSHQQRHGGLRLPDGTCFRCSINLRRTPFSCYPGIRHSNCFISQLNGSGVPYEMKSVFYCCSTGIKMSTTFTCAAGSQGNRRNPDFSRQKKAGQNFSRSKNKQENFDNPDEPDILSSRNGPLLSLSGSPKVQVTASPGSREKEIVQLFRNVQAQLRERAAIKEEKKIESAQSQGERGTVDSLLKLLRKHSVQQGAQRNVNEELTQHQSGQNTRNDEEHNQTFFEIAPNSRDKVPKNASARPASNFRRKSPVPRVKYQPIQPSVDFTVAPSPVEDKKKNEDYGLAKMGTENLETDEKDEMEDLEFELDEMHSDVDNAEEGITENGASSSPMTANLSELKLSELRAIAKSKGMKGYSRLKKADLVELLSEVVD